MRVRTNEEENGVQIRILNETLNEQEQTRENTQGLLLKAEF